MAWEQEWEQHRSAGSLLLVQGSTQVYRGISSPSNEHRSQQLGI